MGNLKIWHARGVCVVVGTSGFTNERIREVESFWTDNDSGCLIVPNFSIGAVLMMRFAELASSFFDSAEIVERHEDTKPDAPSGTALATAVRVGKNRIPVKDASNEEVAKGARGGLVSGVRVHSLRLVKKDSLRPNILDYPALACAQKFPFKGWPVWIRIGGRHQSE